jgi:hypothetical protein
MGNQAGRQPTGRGGTSEHEVCASDRLLRSRTTPRMAPPSDRCGRPESRSIIPEATAASEVDVVAGGWHRFGTAQRLFGIDHPVMDVESLPQALPIGRRGDQPRQAVGATQGLESGNELATKDARQSADGEQEALFRRDPFAVCRQRPTRHQRMEMDVPAEILLPRVQDQRERRHAAQMSRAGGELGERC